MYTFCQFPTGLVRGGFHGFDADTQCPMCGCAILPPRNRRRRSSAAGLSPPMLRTSCHRSFGLFISPSSLARGPSATDCCSSCGETSTRRDFNSDLERMTFLPSGTPSSGHVNGFPSKASHEALVAFRLVLYMVLIAYSLTRVVISTVSPNLSLSFSIFSCVDGSSG